MPAHPGMDHVVEVVMMVPRAEVVMAVPTVADVVPRAGVVMAVLTVADAMMGVLLDEVAKMYHTGVVGLAAEIVTEIETTSADEGLHLFS